MKYERKRKQIQNLNDCMVLNDLLMGFLVTWGNEFGILKKVNNIKEVSSPSRCIEKLPISKWKPAWNNCLNKSLSEIFNTDYQNEENNDLRDFLYYSSQWSDDTDTDNDGSGEDGVVSNVDQKSVGGTP